VTDICTKAWEGTPFANKCIEKKTLYIEYQILIAYWHSLQVNREAAEIECDLGVMEGAV